MGSSTRRSLGKQAWELSRRQHGVIARRQLLDLGLSGQAIAHRLSTGRLHRIERGVYAVGRPSLGRKGRWMAAVLGCGKRAVLSHGSAAALWGIDVERPGSLEITVPFASPRERPGVQVHRRPKLRPSDVSVCQGIPVTTPILTMIDLATRLGERRLERVINEADRLCLVDPETLLAGLDAYLGKPGVGVLRGLLGARIFRLTDSELERRFLRLLGRARLPIPLTGQLLNGFKVDFYWPDLGLVVETDGLRYHRTPAQQTRDRLRDQTHTAAGLTPLRFSHAQVRYETAYVARTLTTVIAGLAT